MSAKKLKTLSEAELHAQLAIKTAELSALRVEHDALLAKLNAAYDAERALQDEVDRRKVGDEVSWEWLLEENGTASTQRYKACQAALTKLGLMSSGYNPKTNQRVITVLLKKGDKQNVKSTYDALVTLLPHLKLTSDDGEVSYVYVNVLEKSCSEHGSYWLAINEEASMYELRITRYSHPSVVKRANSLLELIEFLSTNCYYSDD